MKKVILVTLIVLLNLSLFSQAKKGITFTNIVIGGNYTFLPDTEFFNNEDFGTRYTTETYAVNIALDIKTRFRVGLDYKWVISKGVITGKNNFQMLGMFGQYKLLQGKKGFFFGEINAYTGNYCSCGRDNPYKRANTNLLGWGFGYNHRLYKNLRLDAAFTSSQTLNSVEQPLAFNQYVLGLDLMIPFKKSIKKQ